MRTRTYSLGFWRGRSLGYASDELNKPDGGNLGRRFVLPGRGLHFHELLELQLREITLVDLRVGSGSKVGVG